MQLQKTLSYQAVFPFVVWSGSWRLGRLVSRQYNHHDGDDESQVHTNIISHGIFPLLSFEIKKRRRFRLSKHGYRQSALSPKKAFRTRQTRLHLGHGSVRVLLVASKPRFLFSALSIFHVDLRLCAKIICVAFVASKAECRL